MKSQKLSRGLAAFESVDSSTSRLVSWPLDVSESELETILSNADVFDLLNLGQAILASWRQARPTIECRSLMLPKPLRRGQIDPYAFHCLKDTCQAYRAATKLAETSYRCSTNRDLPGSLYDQHRSKDSVAGYGSSMAAQSAIHHSNSVVRCKPKPGRQRRFLSPRFA